MKGKTLDMIVGPNQHLKSDFYYVKIPSAPKHIEPLYERIYTKLYSIYETTKFATEWVYNILLRK